MPRRRERRCLRFYQRGRVRWVELITESQPARTPQKVRVGDRLIDDFGKQFRTSALLKAPRILFFEDIDAAPPAPKANVAHASKQRPRRTDAERKAHVREIVERLQALPPAARDALKAAEARELAQPPRRAPYSDDPLSELAAFKERVLSNFPDSLQQLKRRPRLREVQALSLLKTQRSKYTAFIDVPLPGGTNAIRLAILCLGCCATTSGEVASLNAGWGCFRVDDRACWYCPPCYGRLMEQHPESIHANAWQTRRARHRHDHIIRDAVSFLDDVDAVRQSGDAQALGRLTDRLLPLWRPSLDPDVSAAIWHQMKVEGKSWEEIKRRAMMAGILLAGASARVPQSIRFGDRTTLHSEDGRTVEAAPDDFAFAYYRWFVGKEAARIAGAELVADAPEIEARPGLEDAQPLLLAQEATAAASRSINELLAPFSPEQRRLIRRAVADNVPLVEAARRLSVPPNTANKQIARIRQKARPFRRSR